MIIICTNPIYCKVFEKKVEVGLSGDDFMFKKEIIPMTREELVDFYDKKNSSLINSYEYITLPCRKCIECQVQNSKEWTLRCLLESRLYSDNCFITLTYNSDNYDQQLHIKHIQLFLKRLRKKYSNKKIRYFGCAEYGSNSSRPHYHLVLFNFDFKDKKFFKRSNRNEILYRSEELETLWSYGFSSIGDLNEKTVKYCSKYLQKVGNFRKNFINDETGEYIEKRKPFLMMSLKPGIGLEWFLKNYKGGDYIFLNGQKYDIPEYFLKFIDDEKYFYLKCKKRLLGSFHYSSVEKNLERQLLLKKKLTLYGK